MSQIGAISTNIITNNNNKEWNRWDTSICLVVKTGPYLITSKCKYSMQICIYLCNSKEANQFPESMLHDIFRLLDSILT